MLIFVSPLRSCTLGMAVKPGHVWTAQVDVWSHVAVTSFTAKAGARTFVMLYPP